MWAYMQHTGEVLVSNFLDKLIMSKMRIEKKKKKKSTKTEKTTHENQKQTQTKIILKNLK